MAMACYAFAYLTGYIRLDAEMAIALAAVFCGWFWVWNRTQWKIPLGTSTAPWLQNTAGLFPALFLIFALRAFLYEPFFVPSESMEPTLTQGDVIVVSKVVYGVRVPVINRWIAGPAVERGDPVVFRYPVDPTTYFVKRVVALGGDTIVIRGHELWVNGRAMEDVSYATNKQDTPDVEASLFLRERWPHACIHANDVIACKIPEGHFFAMGDNRAHSYDSRFWGFVPYDYLMGKATHYVVNTEQWDKRNVLGLIR